ncbi:metalloregulator ArsR/SmtB family transcription factor [Ligilactobacillus faecis]|uniref:Metalloregulator ArsR/SmtB family transcription factor n=1 Tax=Ligilactobacillus faecis TaxID=762833 RepID=A0ABV4DQT9_9LACO
MTIEKKLTLPTEEETNASVQIFKAFGNETRYKILSLLFGQKLTVNEIAQTIEMTQSAVSHQLKILRQTGLVSSKRDGQHVYYALADQHIIMIFKQVKEHISED